MRRLCVDFIRVAAFCLVAAIAGVGAASAQTHPALSGTSLPPLLPLKLLSGGDDDGPSGHQVSPDGKRLAWTQRIGGRRQLHVRPIEGGTDVSVRTAQNVDGYTWASDSRHLVLSIDPDRGAENHQLLLVDADAPEAGSRNVTPWPGTRNSLVNVFLQGDQILFRSNRRDAAISDLYRVSLAGRAEPEMIARNPGNIRDWWLYPSGKVAARLTTAGGAEGRRMFQRCANDGCVRVFDMAWDENLSLFGLVEGEDSAWALSNRNRDRIAVVRLDLKTGAETVEHDDPVVDVAGLRFDPTTRRPLLATSWPGRQRLHFFAEGLGKDIKPLLAEGVEFLSIGSADLAHRWMVLTLSGPRVATRTVLLDRQTGKRSPLTVSPWEAWQDTLSDTKPFDFAARDGRRLHGYLTVPRGTRGKGLPTVIFVHGGPWARDFGTPSNTVQFLANRGYAVVQVNYRGSIGYGRAHLLAAIGEFGRKMSDDVDDAFKWAVDQGIADPARTAIMGASYGGYAANVGVTRTPTLYAAGVSIVGMSDLPGFIDTVPPSWDRNFWYRFIGRADQVEARARMWEVSPLSKVHQVVRPVLILHGANDTRVRRDQGERFAGALRSLRKPVELQVYEGEGHSFTRPATRADYMGRVERFLARHLGGRATPAGAATTAGPAAPPPPSSDEPQSEKR